MNLARQAAALLAHTWQVCNEGLPLGMLLFSRGLTLDDVQAHAWMAGAIPDPDLRAAYATVIDTMDDEPESVLDLHPREIRAYYTVLNHMQEDPA